MSSVYLCIPSARPDGGTIPKWTAAGYKTAIWRDSGAPPIEANITIIGKYPGYSKACNALIKMALADQACQWVVGGGDDVLPDPDHGPEEIAEECEEHFTCAPDLPGTCAKCRTYGVMQPTGDPWRDLQGRIIERIAGSPWIGRAFAERVYGGNGPWWPDYFHCFGDEELMLVAQRMGVYWQRPDLVHHHEHWARKSGDVKDMPEFLKEANSAAHWEKYKALFMQRKAAGFPGSEVRV
ncbi:MAG: hypothetical protein V4555_17800 [Acidobacteriota bacterium]